MEEFIDLLKYTVPAIVVLGASYLTLNRLITKDISVKKIDLASNNQKIITPMRMQAYERVILLLERIQPEAIILRNRSRAQTARQMQLVAIQDIRKEFEHNLSQQIYISSEGWLAVKRAKDAVMQAVTEAGAKLPKDAPAGQFSMIFITMFGELEDNPMAIAGEIIKREVRDFYGN